MSRAQLEKRYGIKIADDSYYNPFTFKYVRAYKIYSADGCPWENGLRTLKAVEAECKKYADTLIGIKACVDFNVKMAKKGE